VTHVHWPEAHVKKLILVAALAAATLGGAGIASAQYYPLPGQGYYYDEPPQRYYRRDRDYDEQRYYRRDRDYDRRGYRTFNGCPPRYTIQDGECKPYRGY
jgi:hypothetical protein